MDSPLPRSRKVVLTILAVILAWAGRVYWPDSIQRRPLPDGSELALYSVTFGQRHRMSTGHRWQDRLGSFLPERLARRLGRSGSNSARSQSASMPPASSDWRDESA